MTKVNLLYKGAITLTKDINPALAAIFQPLFKSLASAAAAKHLFDHATRMKQSSDYCWITACNLASAERD